MTAEELIKNGELPRALEAAREAVRSAPADSKPRIFLFQLECVLGCWDKALAQLQILSDVDADSNLLAHIFGPVIECELLRGEVFAGKRTPIVFGEPEPWMGDLVQAGQLAAAGETTAAEALRTRAFDAAPPSGGSLNGEAFEWLADADPRLGPMFEVIMDGVYRWVPVIRVASIRMEPPQDLRDLVWMPAQFSWSNGGTANGFIPARYPGSEKSLDSAVQLGRRTEWEERPGGWFFGSGQRQLATDKGEYSLLQIREISIEPVTANV